MLGLIRSVQAWACLSNWSASHITIASSCAAVLDSRWYQAQMMAREGVIIDRSTLSFWIGYAAAEEFARLDQ